MQTIYFSLVLLVQSQEQDQTIVAAFRAFRPPLAQLRRGFIFNPGKGGGGGWLWLWFRTPRCIAVRLRMPG